MVGFSDQSALTRCFRRRRGTTPDTVRKSRT
jgi:AraC-like DNA-binding protein